MTLVQALPIALLRICMQPRHRDNMIPYEILQGRPYQIMSIKGEIHMRVKIDLQKYLTTFKFHFAEGPEIRHVIQTYMPICSTMETGFALNGETVTLQVKWKGPFQILATLTKTRGAGREPWIHCSRVKTSAPETTGKQTLIRIRIM